ncbi:hypothetical protein [Nocardia beijingensis]|uniref:hypothetical protein n=1 Tax=Nocardia beijingensis TaxID=95162 RepID=UPI000A76C39A|nr:hypothetical protein [Nocardia beijingensis]
MAAEAVSAVAADVGGARLGGQGGYFAGGEGRGGVHAGGHVRVDRGLRPVTSRRREASLLSENLGRTDPQYNYALVIDYNRFPVVPNRGSAFFVHVEVGRPTAGCVAVGDDVMRTLLTTLEPSRKPVIGIYAI